VRHMWLQLVNAIMYLRLHKDHLYRVSGIVCINISHQLWQHSFKFYMLNTSLWPYSFFCTTFIIMEEPTQTWHKKAVETFQATYLKKKRKFILVIKVNRFRNSLFFLFSFGMTQKKSPNVWTETWNSILTIS